VYTYYRAMAFPSADSMDLYFDPRNSARPTRARFNYQDECVALRCIPNLASEAVKAVVVEWSTDYLAVLPDGRVELVSIKHRDPGGGEWPWSELQKVVADLHRVWQVQREACLCVFASNAAISRDAAKKLGMDLARTLRVTDDEAGRFAAALALVPEPLPRRNEITAVGIRGMAGALSVLGLDERHAESCYRALVARITEVATEGPDRPAEWVARLSGAMTAVRDRSRPDLAAHTLPLASLRELVARTHEACSRVEAATVVVRPRTAPPAADGWRGGDEVRVGRATYLVHDPVETLLPPDRSYRWQSAAGRQIEPVERDVWIEQVEVLRDTATARARLEAAGAAADLAATIPGLPRVLARAGRHLVITTLDGAVPVTTAFGPPPWPGVALDAFITGLQPLVNSLGALHARNLAHRALQPSSLLLRAGRIHLRDVGLAAVPPVAGEGHAPYRAPEQLRPIVQPPGPYTDVYALAAIIYHMAAGQVPDAARLPPSLLRPGLAPALDDVLLEGLAAERPSLDRFVARLNVVLSGGGAVRP
jgi:hypothetical protein